MQCCPKKIPLADWRPGSVFLKDASWSPAAEGVVPPTPRTAAHAMTDQCVGLPLHNALNVAAFDDTQSRPAVSPFECPTAAAEFGFLLNLALGATDKSASLRRCSIDRRRRHCGRRRSTG